MAEKLSSSIGDWSTLLMKEFSKESDRASVIIAVAILENSLEFLLKSYLVQTDSSNDSLFDGSYAPISSLSAKIDVAYRLGLISNKFSRDLHIIRRIRNNFAHNIAGCDFQNPSVKSRIETLNRSTGMGKRNPKTRAIFEEGTRGDFIMDVSWMHWVLHSLAENTNTLKQAELEWGYRIENLDDEEKKNNT